jgi:glycosyltransferase 2 family protein
MKSRWQIFWLATRWATVAATAAVLVNLTIRHSNELSNFSFDMAPYWLVPALLATSVANLLLPLGWRCLLHAYGHEINKSSAIKLWCFAQTGRYLPTGLIAVASRISLALKFSIPKSVTAASIAVETLFLVGWAAVVCAIFIPSTFLPLAFKCLLGLAALSGLLLLPLLMSGVGAKLTKTNPLKGDASTRRHIYQAGTLFGASVLIRTLGIVAVAFAFLDIQSSDINLLVGASYAGILAGMIGITPAGIGVREGVITTILATQMGIGDATAFAVLSRAWEFGAEMLFLGAASWWDHKKKGSAAERQAT